LKGELELASIIKTALANPTKVIKALEKESTTPYTEEEALTLIINKNLSRSTYEYLQQDLNRRGFKAFPPYYKIQQAKLKCHPEAPLQVNERKAFVPLNSLLEHTVKRIVALQDVPLNQYLTLKEVHEMQFQLYCSWGFDGSTGQSQYKQKIDENSEDDHSIFCNHSYPTSLGFL